MKKKHSILFLAIGLLASGVARADVAPETELKMYTGEEVVVTATRSEQLLEKVPTYIEVITADEIKESGAESVPDIMSTLTSVNITNNNRPIVDMGGFGESANRHVVVLIDGRKLNPVDMAGPRWNAIPVDNIERIEVLHGGASVLYGGNAMGGVINIITKQASEVLAANIDMAAGTYGKKSVDGSVSLGSESVSLLVGGSLFETDGYRDHSEEEQSNIYSRLFLKPSDELALNFDISDTYSDYNLPGGLTFEQLLDDRKQVQPGSELDRTDDRLTRMGIGVEYDAGKSGKLFLDASYTWEERDADMLSYTSYMDTEIRTRLFSPKYVLEKDFWGVGNRLTLGSDFGVTDYNATQAALEDSPSVWMNHDRESIAFYLHDEVTLTEEWQVNAGYRYEKVELDLGRRDNTSTTLAEADEYEWAAELGLAYNFQPGSKLYAKVNRAYRYPVIDELVSWWTGSVTQLDPETSISYEIGLRYAVNDKLVLNARGYLMDVEDEIMFNSTSSSNENFAETRHLGMDLNGQYQLFSDLDLFAGVSYSEAEFSSALYDGNAIPLVPDWKGNAGLEYDFGSGLSSRVVYTYVGDQYMIGDFLNEQEKLDEYGTVDVALDYSTRSFDLYLNASNIFSEKYASYASDYGYGGFFYPMPEAEYTFGMRMRF